MIDYILYEPITGKIVQTGQSPESQIDIQGTKDYKMLVAKGEPETHYVYSGSLMLRPDMSLTIEDNKIHGIPVPSSIFINGTYYPCTEEEVDFDFTFPGEYHVRIESFPYLDFETKLVQK